MKNTLAILFFCAISMTGKAQDTLCETSDTSYEAAKQACNNECAVERKDSGENGPVMEMVIFNEYGRRVGEWKRHCQSRLSEELGIYTNGLRARRVEIL